MATIQTALELIVAQLPGGGEPRSGQRQMAQAVADAIRAGRHLIVQAGTGTGKSIGYLLPAIASGRRVLVATATKALQDQLATKDLPFLQRAMGGSAFSFAVVKGRNNYACLQRLREHGEANGKLELDEFLPQVRVEIRQLAEWASSSPTGDRAELSFEPLDRAWQAVSVTSNECPGATSCPMGGSCFAERARRAAADADVIVVNLHLYGLHMASGGVLLPDHDIVVIDEAHQLEDTISATSGLELTGGRLAAIARLARSVLSADELTADVARRGTALSESLAPHIGQRLTTPLPSAISAAIAGSSQSLTTLLGALRAIDTTVTDADQRKVRVQKAATSLIDELNGALIIPKTAVTWVEGDRSNPRLRIAPIDVGPVLEVGLWEQHPTILTSATIPLALPKRVALPADGFDSIDVGSPFDYENHAVLYCAKHLPDPRQSGFDAAVHEELQLLIEAAGGRTLALFTSWRAMRAAYEALAEKLTYQVLTQADLPKPALLAEFTRDETSCLFATAGLFQGIDIPGRTLSLVTIDRIPFPRPDEPLLQARRDLAGRNAFREVDLPRAATLLAQAAGRLIRSATDQGVVAVLDPRLATASYRWDIVNALPPMRRTADRAEAESFLGSLTH